MRHFAHRVLVLAALIAGCDPATAEERDRAADIDASIKSATEITALMNAVVEPELPPDPDVIQAVIDLVVQRLDQRFGARPCVDISSPAPQALQVTLDECRLLGIVRLDGELRLDVELDGDTLAFRLQASPLTVAQTTTTGDWNLRVPTDGGAFEWEGSTMIERPFGRTLSSSSWLGWDRTVDGCLLFSYGAEVTGPRRMTTVSASDVSVCPGKCPTSGVVSLTFDTGSTLAWEFQGGDIAEVTGPGGRSFVVDLTCE